MIIFACLIVVAGSVIGSYLLMIRKLRKCSKELADLKNDVLVVRKYYVSIIEGITNYNTGLASRVDEANDRINDIEKVINCPLINCKQKEE